MDGAHGVSRKGARRGRGIPEKEWVSAKPRRRKSRQKSMTMFGRICLGVATCALALAAMPVVAQDTAYAPRGQ
jgi:hypothetical protein